MAKKPAAKASSARKRPGRSRTAARAAGTAQATGEQRPSRSMQLVPAASVLTSVTRIASFDGASVSLLPKSEWETGDYVIGDVPESSNPPYDLELTTGRMADVVAGDAVVGAFGRRSATLEAVGDWTEIGSDLRMHALTRAGVLGRATSATPASRTILVPLTYRGHVMIGGEKATMPSFVTPVEPRPLTAPVVLVIGTSMSAGKTTSAVVLIRRLREMGLRVAASKVTGVARYREILGMSDAGASPTVDFVDAGLPSTIVGPDEYHVALEHMLSRLAAGEPDVVVIECGSSPLEAYNVDLAAAALAPNVRCTVLCASDPYAVVGVASAYDVVPDLVAGKATSTDAGVALCERLSGVLSMNLIEPATHPVLDTLLAEKLGL
jgi:hypothetical protein